MITLALALAVLAVLVVTSVVMIERRRRDHDGRIAPRQLLKYRE
jgi:hypothetical protein